MIRYSYTKGKVDGPVGMAIYLDAQEKTNYMYNILPGHFFDLNYTLEPHVIKYLAKYFGVKVTDKDIDEYTGAQGSLKTKTKAAMDSRAAFKRLDKLFGDLWRPKLYKLAGRVGYSWHAESGKWSRIFAIKNEDYKTPQTYKQKLNKGVKVGRTLHFGRITTTINKIEKDYKLLTKSGKITKKLDTVLPKIRQEEGVDLRKSKIVKGVSKQQKVSDARARQSLEQGLRLGILESDRKEYKGEEVVARLLATTAEEPDLDHALLEGVWRPLDEVLEDLARPGCQHDYEVKELKDFKGEIL